MRNKILLTILLSVLFLSVPTTTAEFNVQSLFDMFDLTIFGTYTDREYAIPQVLDYDGQVVNAGLMDGYSPAGVPNYGTDSTYGYFKGGYTSYIDLIQTDTFTKTDQATGKLLISMQYEDMNIGNGVTDFSKLSARVYVDGSSTYDTVYFNVLDQSGYFWGTVSTPHDYTYYDPDRKGYVKVRVYHSSLNPDDVAVYNIKYGMAYIPDSTATGTATPTNSPPIAKITYLEQGGSKLTLYGTESTDTDGTISEFSWYIDNIYVNGQSTFTHVFEEPGNYVIRLEVTDDDGCRSSALLFITISKPDDNSPGVIIDNIDDSKAITQELINEGSQKGIWIENGRLMIPGFTIVFSILGLLAAIGISHKRKR